MRALVIAVAGAALLAGCSSPGTPSGTDVLSYSLASESSPTAAVRAALIAGTPPRKRETVTCREATIEIAFARRSNPESGAVYLDDLHVKVVDSDGQVVTARQLLPENRGSETSVEMALPIVVRVQRDRSYGDCSYLLRAGGAGTIERN